MYMAQGNNTDSFVGHKESWKQAENTGQLIGKVQVLESKKTTFEFNQQSIYKSTFNLKIDEKLKGLTIQFGIYASNQTKSAYNNWNIRTPKDYDKFKYDITTVKVLLINPFKVGTTMPLQT